MSGKPSKASLAGATNERETARLELAEALARRPIAELAALPLDTWQRLGASGLLLFLGTLAQRGRSPKYRFLDTGAVRRRLMSWRDRHAEQLFQLRHVVTMVPSPMRGVIAGIAAGVLCLAVSIALA